MPTLINGADGLRALAGQSLGSTEWQTMAFERIQAFADATDDHQWIHVDVERAKAESPFGGPIAHGYLTLSLVAGKFFELVQLEGFKMVINYGCNKVRFPNPLKEGMRYRLALTLAEVAERGEWIESTFVATIEIEGQAKPACVAEVLYRYQPA